MANTASARKRIRQIERRTERNHARKSRMRTFVKKVETAIATGDKAAAAAALQAAQPEMQRAAGKGVVHKQHRRPQAFAFVDSHQSAACRLTACSWRPPGRDDKNNILDRASRLRRATVLTYGSLNSLSSRFISNKNSFILLLRFTWRT